MKLFVFLFAISLMVMSCEQEQKPDEIKLDKHGSVDVKLSQKQLDNSVVIITEKTFYDNYTNTIAKKISYDTLPSLGFAIDTLNTGKQNDDGDDIDTVVHHKKMYQFFVSVKPHADEKK